MQQQYGTSAPPDPELVVLVKRKTSLSRILMLVMFVAYFGFMGLLAFAPELLASHVGAATLGIPVGISVLVVTWAVTGIYVRWANGAYDAAIARLKSK